MNGHREKVCWCRKPGAAIGEICPNSRCGFRVSEEERGPNSRGPALAKGALRVRFRAYGGTSDSVVIERELGHLVEEHGHRVADPVREAVEAILAGQKKETKLSKLLRHRLEELDQEEAPAHPVLDAIADRIEELDVAKGIDLLVHPVGRMEDPRRVEVLKDGLALRDDEIVFQGGRLEGLRALTIIERTLGLKTLRNGNGRNGQEIRPFRQLSSALTTALKEGRMVAEGPSVEDCGVVEIDLLDECHKYRIHTRKEASDDRRPPVLDGERRWWAY